MLTRIWDIASIISNTSSKRFAIIILNEALNDQTAVHSFLLWSKALIRICVDGGTNQFHHYSMDFSSKKEDTKIPLPDIISGDFDSIDENVKEYYQNLGVQIQHTPDQNETDFTKSLLVLGDHLAKNNLEIDHVLVLAGINSLRFDQTIGNLHTLYKMRSLVSFPVIIMSGKSLFWLLEPGFHTFKIPSTILTSKDDSWCGYASLSDPSLVSTRGLKWDIDKKEISFGQTISTSNTYAPGSDGKVSLECTKPLLWFMGWNT